jgi:hypothetical protein
VDIGGDPGRDESGLPPVDIEVPDDARELDRDVQAYYRELRAQRRRRRVGRLTAPFTKHGMVVPLVAGLLAATLFAGTMLTVITSTPDTTILPRPPRSPVQRSTPAPGQMGGALPAGEVLVDNTPAPLRGLTVPSVLAVVPRNCGCMTALGQLMNLVAKMQIVIYFVATDGGGQQLALLAKRAGWKRVQVVEDSQNIVDVYHPAGLTAILVHTDGIVTDVNRGLTPGFHLEPALQSLIHPGLAYRASPTPT